MGDTSKQERRIKQRVHEKLRPAAKKQSWQVLFTMVAAPVIALFLFFTINPSDQLSSDKGPGTPYDPLDDLAQIQALQETKELSTIEYEEFSKLPHFDQVDDLYYVDEETFTLKGSSDNFHTVIERKSNLYDDVVYQAGDIVRTMTDATSHLPTYASVYYEVIAVPGDRVMLKDGQLEINGKSPKSEIKERYKEQGVTIVGGYDQLLNAREYFLLNHFPASETVQGATITPVHKIYGQVVGVASEERTQSMYLDYLSEKLTRDYTPEQYFDLYLYDILFGLNTFPETSAFTETNRLGELLIEAAYRKVIPISENEVEIRYEYGREGVADRVFQMGWDANTGSWLLED